MKAERLKLQKLKKSGQRLQLSIEKQPKRQLSLKNSINNRIKTTSNDYYRYDIKLNVSQNNEKFHVVDFSTAPPMLK
ncbi:232_t:CDS:2 [Funneliformis geosporum]|uniref:232_t:CDS:1 n=1 Tax=Funneliformis geosporum TaxID=1117311 RepID=A0A9W4WXD5_9GLOM|nr:232_t:CDS:2 [Funneliformis geosporum]